MNKEEKRINYLLDAIIECPSMQADELGKRIRRLFKTIDKQEKEIKQLKEDMSNMYDEKVVRNILEEVGISKYEIDEILN